MIGLAKLNLVLSCSRRLWRSLADTETQVFYLLKMVADTVFDGRKKVVEIKKVLNNNVVITADAKGQEIVVMGRGLAFNKRPGDFISPDKIDKVYQLNNNNLFHKFQELLLEVPAEYVEITDNIIQYATEKLNTPLNESLYLSLTDHLYTSVERAKKGVEVKNVLLWDIKRFFPKEYAIGQKTIAKVRENYGIQLSDDEAGFIALHLVNAQGETKDEDMTQLTQTMQDILNIARRHFKMDFDEESVYFYRFSAHLRFFVSRLLQAQTHEDESADDLFFLVQRKYPTAFAGVQKIATYVAEKFQHHLSSDEQLYLTIHLARLAQKDRQLT